MEADRGFTRIRNQHRQTAREQRSERQDQQRAGQLEREAAQRETPRRRVLRDGAEEREQAAAEIRADHEAQGDLQRNHAGRGERRGQQDRGKARIGQHGERGADQCVEHGVAGQCTEHHAHAGALHHRLSSFDDQTQRQQNQTEADQRAADLAETGLLARQEQRHAEQNQDRRQPGQIECEDPRHQRGADVGTEHDRETTGERQQSLRRERRDDHRGRVTALHETRDANTREESPPAATGAAPQHAAQVGAEDSQDAGAHNVRAPHEERHTGQKV